ncbi:MAG TPA: MarR family transcriptional regulator [Syntrophales bacterium]|nr:MarR family transcriptional regulator [Syntrophales bacterium]
MKNRVVQVFSKKDEEFVSVLISLGTKRPVARVLVFLLNRMEGTMREIERVTDMNQPVVSQAVRYMVEQGWVTTKEIPPEWKGRPIKLVSLAIPLDEIFQMIGEKKETHANHQLSLLKKVRTFVG